MDNVTSSDQVERILHDMKQLAENLDRLYTDVKELLKEEEDGNNNQDTSNRLGKCDTGVTDDTRRGQCDSQADTNKMG